MHNIFPCAIIGHWMIVLEIIPEFSLYRGLYELGQYAARASETGGSGMRWSDLNDHTNGMRDVLIIIILEWLVLLPVAYYLDHAASVGHNSSLLSVIKCLLKKDRTWRRVTVNRVPDSEIQVEMEKADIINEVIFLCYTRPFGFYVICCQFPHFQALLSIWHSKISPTHTHIPNKNQAKSHITPL